MKAIFFAASLCFLMLGGFLKGEQSGAPTSQTEEITQLRKQIETLEERVGQLEKRLDGRARPKIVPLTCGVSRELP
jgi:hypothetical protein